MICPRCKYRFRKVAGRNLLESAGSRQPIELQTHSSDMTALDAASVADQEGYDLSLVLCPCGHPLMVAVYRCSESESADYQPVILEVPCASAKRR